MIKKLKIKFFSLELKIFKISRKILFGIHRKFYLQLNTQHKDDESETEGVD